MQYGNKTGFIWLHVVQITHRKALPSIKDADVGRRDKYAQETISFVFTSSKMFLGNHSNFHLLISISVKSFEMRWNLLQRPPFWILLSNLVAYLRPDLSLNTLFLSLGKVIYSNNQEPYIGSHFSQNIIFLGTLPPWVCCKPTELRSIRLNL